MNFWIEIMMMFLGMIISTIFQDYINQGYLKIRRSLFKVFRRKKTVGLAEAQNFVIGQRETSVVVLDGDGQLAFNNKNINIHVVEDFPHSLPQEIYDLREETVKKLQQKKERGENIPWNGSTLSLYKFVVSRTADFEDYKMDLHLAKCDYYTVYSTIHNLGSGSGSLTERYVTPYTFENNAIYPLPNAVGLSLCVRTKDNKLIFAVRSADSGYRPGESDVSVVEGLNPQYDLQAHSLDLLSACNRAVYEEIGNIESEKLEVSVLGLVFDKAYNQWNFVGDVYVDMTQEQIIARRNSGASGKWELRNLDFVRFHPKDIFQYLSTHKMWDMGIVTVFFSLVHSGFKKEKLEAYFKKYKV